MKNALNNTTCAFMMLCRCLTVVNKVEGVFLYTIECADPAQQLFQLVQAGTRYVTWLKCGPFASLTCLMLSLYVS
jgi:hypothetical protein